jgi:hypothetical protein
MELSGSSGSRVLVVGPQRPALDSNHIHVYNCSELSGATSLVDSGTGGKNLTVTGEGTECTLGESRYGSVPWFRSLKDGYGSPFASSTSLNLSFSALTIECVVVWQSIGGGWRNLVDIRKSSNTSHAIFLETYNGNLYGAVTKDGSSAYTQQNFTPTVGVPQHYMFVYDSSLSSPNTLKMYLNGVLTGVSAVGALVTSYTSLDKISVCGVSDGSRGSAQCYIRDIRISNIARSATYAMQSANALTHL